MKNVEYKRKDLKIIVRHGDENCARVENIYEENNIFYQSYVHAVFAVERIIESAEKYIRENDNSKLLGYANNMIVFSAERGEGKTSAMISFGAAMEEMEAECDRKNVKNMWETSALTSRFCVLNSIDPTFMEDNESILKIILSRMFTLFKTNWEECRKCGRAEDLNQEKDKIMELFRQCYRDIDILKQKNGKENVYDDLYYLADLGDSTNLKVSLYELIRHFLKFLKEYSKDGNLYLIIEIDDVDLNAEKAYDILEDLRKYMMLPNVIILLSADLKQLRQALENKYIKDYERVLKYNGSMRIRECRNMAERYIEKVFPVIQQIHLPKISKCINADRENLSIEYQVENGENGQFKNILKTADGDETTINNYQQILLRLIYEKTCLILLEKNYLHDLLPQKMRELTHFLEYMSTLKSYDECFSWTECLEYYYTKRENDAEKEKVKALEDKIWTRYENLKRFGEYLEEYWCPYYLSQEQQDVYKNIQNADLKEQKEQVTKIVLKYLKVHEFVEEGDIEENIGEIEKLVRTLSQKQEDETQKKFFVLLTVYFSISRNKTALHDLLTANFMEHLKGMLEPQNFRFDWSLDDYVLNAKMPIDMKKLRGIAQKKFADYEGWLSEYVETYIEGATEEKGYFDFFGPFMQCVKEKTMNMIGNRDAETYANNLKHMGSMLQIILNSDLKEKVNDEIKNIKLDLKEKLYSPTNIISELYVKIDRCVENVTYLKLVSDTQKMFEDEKTRQNPFFSLVFICNHKFIKYYFNELQNALLKKIPPNLDLSTYEKLGKMERYEHFFYVIENTQIRDQVKITDFDLDEIMLEDKKIKRLFDVYNENNRKMLKVLEQMKINVAKLNENNEGGEDDFERDLNNYNEILLIWNERLKQI